MAARSKSPELIPVPALSPTDEFERRLAREFSVIAGVDEAGRGPLAGPVVAAAVVLPRPCPIDGLADSKTLAAGQREDLALQIREHAVAVGVGSADHTEIDSINILQATFVAMRRAIDSLTRAPNYLLVDGNFPLPDWGPHQKPLIKGDGRSVSIAAAGIIAKVERDAHMRAMHDEYPAYSFNTNMGYGTRAHLVALTEHGPCPIHRRSFRGVLPEPTRDPVDELALPLAAS